MPASKTSSHSPLTLPVVLLLVGKACGVAGLVLGTVHRVAGGVLLALDAVFIVAAVMVALRNQRRLKRTEEDDAETVARLVREGTLEQYLRDAEDEARRDRIAPLAVS